MVVVQSLERLRAAGGGERWAMARHALSIYNNVAVSALYIHSSFMSLTAMRTCILRAVDLVISQHPILSAIPLGEENQKQGWARLEEIDMTRCITFSRRSQSWDLAASTDGELDALLEKEHNTSFKVGYGELPFWRLIVLHEDGLISRFVAAFVAHHAVADTLSALAFHRSLTDGLSHVVKLKDGGEREAAVSLRVRPPNTPLLPSLEQLHALPLSWRFIIKSLRSSLLSSAKPGLWTGSPVTDAFGTKQSRFRSLTLSPHNTARLQTLIRKHEVTMTSFLQVMLVNALFSAIPSDYSTLSVDGAISFRRFLNPNIITRDAMGCYVSSYAYTHHRNTLESQPWDEAKIVRKAILDELSKKGRDTIIGMSRYIFSYKRFFNAMKTQPRETSLEVSNVGQYVPGDQHNDASWRVDRMVFSQSADATGAAILCSIVTGNDNRLTMGFSWMNEDIENVVCARLMEIVYESLQSIIAA